jgi:hypothetical protein
MENKSDVRRETMKRSIVIITISAILISACSVFGGGQDATPLPPTPSPIPTAMPDPCAPENLLKEVEKVQDVVNAFQDVAYVANFTPQTELILPILQLQEIRREMQKLEVPACEDAIKTSSINYMNATINYLAFFMGGESQENVDAGIQNSQVLWQVVLSEFSKLLSSAGLIEQVLPDISNAVPSTTDSGIFITNGSAQGVNIRTLPDLNSEIVASFEPGMQALGLARNETGDWIQINLDGVIGWVFAETITASAPVEDLPVFEAVQ